MQSEGGQEKMLQEVQPSYLPLNLVLNAESHTKEYISHELEEKEL